MELNDKFKILFGIVIFINSIVLCSILSYAQDTTRVDSETTKIIQSNDNVEIGEIELMEITIEAVIEKPRVSILPKRMEPKLGEMEFIDRSFEKELKQGPEEPFFIKDHVATPLKIKKLKEKIKKSK